MPISGAIALLAFLPVLAAVPAAPRPFSVDDLLRLEQVCQVAFDPSGRILLFERVAAYEDSGDFAQPWQDLGWNRSKLYGVDLEDAGDVRLLFDQARDDGNWLGSFSPNGSKAAVYRRTSAGGVGFGVYDFEQRRRVASDFAPDVLWYFGPHHVWLSDTTLVFAALPEGVQSFDFGRQPLKRLPELWRRARDGTAATVGVLESGRIADQASSQAEGFLVKLDTATATTSILARGDFLELDASPDGGHVAAVKRGTPLQPEPRQPLEHHALRSHTPLVLLNVGAAGEETAVCPGCDALPGSLQWSKDGDRLLFYARRHGERWTDGRYYRYRMSTESLEPLLPDTLEVVRSRDYIAPPAKAEWFGDDALVHARPVNPSGEPARPDWYLVDPRGAARNVTASFPEPPSLLAAVSAEAAFFMSGGDLWRVSSDGSRRTLTEDIDAPVALWQPAAAAGCGSRPRLDSPRLVLRVRGTRSSHFVLLELATGERRVLQTPSPGATLLAVSNDSRAAVFSEEPSGAPGRLTLTMADRRTRPLLEFNAHMADVARPNHVRVGDPAWEGSGPAGWLLLPPWHRPGDRHPLIVLVYPGSVRTAEPGWSLSRPHPLSPHLFAGQGYAVLFPDIPLTPEGEPADPLVGLAERVMPAVDRVIADGYVDPERIGLFGHSFGAYGALGILSQTGRFKAAVAANGISNLFSSYGTFDVRFRIEASGALRLFAPGWTESGQGRMGVPPWRDPERYLRNSPLFHAERIDTPVMLVHGDLDYVSMDQSEQMFTALHRLNKEAVFLRYWGEGHVLASPANIRDFWKRVIAWYDRYLGPTGGGDTPCGPCQGRHMQTRARSGGSERE